MSGKQYKVKTHQKIRLSLIPTDSAGEKADKKELKKKLADNIDKISDLQYKLYAESRQSLLIILQGMDSAGKDGTIKSIMSGVNAQGVSVHSFKHPSGLELEHDYLWRHEENLPEHGHITIFNRSQYENVLISKVHPEFVIAERLPGITSVKKIDKKFWNTRYKQINHFEKRTVQNGTQVLKLFLHLSKREQCSRFLKRINKKHKHWKFSSADINERRFWNQYRTAYELALMNTSTKMAPWYIIPADEKLFAHVLISEIILEKLQQMDPSFPPSSEKETAFMEKAKIKLMGEYKRGKRW